MSATGSVTPATLALVNARIGDTLLVTPALRAIKAAWPDRPLVVRAHRERAPLLAGLPFVDRVEAAGRMRMLCQRCPGWSGCAIVYLLR